MGRKIRTTLPSLEKNLIPKWPDRNLVRRRDEEAKQRQAFYFNRRHGVKELPTLRPGDQVLTKLDGEKVWKGPASVLQECSTPRSYQVESPGGGEVRRNRRHFQQVPPVTEGESIDTEQGVSEPSEETPQQSSGQGLGGNNESPTPTPDGQIRTRFGRICKPVIRMDI